MTFDCFKGSQKQLILLIFLEFGTYAFHIKFLSNIFYQRDKNAQNRQNAASFLKLFINIRLSVVNDK